MFAFIEQSNIFMLVLTAIYVASTVLLLLIASRANKLATAAVEEMKRQRKLELRPYVSFDAYRDKAGNCFFKLENTGKMPAFNVQVAFDKPLSVCEDRNAEEKKYKEISLSMFKKIPLLAPNNPYIEYVTYIGLLSEVIDKDEPITGKFYYEALDKTKYEYKLAFDLKLISMTFVDDTRLVSSDAELLGTSISDTLTKIETQLRMRR